MLINNTLYMLIYILFSAKNMIYYQKCDEGDRILNGDFQKKKNK